RAPGGRRTDRTGKSPPRDAVAAASPALPPIDDPRESAGSARDSPPQHQERRAGLDRERSRESSGRDPDLRPGVPGEGLGPARPPPGPGLPPPPPPPAPGGGREKPSPTPGRAPGGRRRPFWPVDGGGSPARAGARGGRPSGRRPPPASSATARTPDSASRS